MSTEMALLQFGNKKSKDLNNKNITLGVFLDLLKAFETVNYKIYLAKLYNYGIYTV